MGSSQCEMEVDDGPQEEPELEEGDTDTPSPVDDHNHSSPQRNGSVNANGNENEEKENGNEKENEKDNAHLSSKRACDSEDQEGGGGSDNKTQNGGGSSDSATPRSSSGRLLVRTFRDGGGGRSSNGTKRLKMIEEEEEAGTKEEQAEFLKVLEAFYKGKLMDFKPPKFYGVPLNCLKLWRSVIRLGGYDRVTTYKLWRQIGESFHPPKTCTTISWTFRIFYEKSLLEYEKHKREIGELKLPEFPEDTAVDNEGNSYQTGSGRGKRDAAARAMQGWHSGIGEVGEPTIKDKSINTAQKREKHLKNIGVKQKKPSNSDLAEHEMPEANKQSMPTVLDAGPPADWVKINVRESKDCFEVYALVPGLLREEVRVQSDPAGRLVITGQPDQLDNPWGITPFRKVVLFPVRIDPLHTSAVVSLHGRLFVRVPFDRSNT